MKPHSVWDHVEIDHIADLTLYPMTIYPICSVHDKISYIIEYLQEIA